MLRLKNRIKSDKIIHSMIKLYVFKIKNIFFIINVFFKIDISGQKLQVMSQIQ